MVSASSFLAVSVSLACVEMRDHKKFVLLFMCPIH